MAGAIVTALLQDKPKGFSVYNVCTGHKITVKQLAEMVKGLWGSESTSKVAFKDARDGDIKHSACRPDKAREGLGFEAGVKVEDGLKQTFEWFKEKSHEGKESKKDDRQLKADKRSKKEDKKEDKGSKEEDKKEDRRSKKEDKKEDKGSKKEDKKEDKRGKKEDKKEDKGSKKEDEEQGEGNQKKDNDREKGEKGEDKGNEEVKK